MDLSNFAGVLASLAYVLSFQSRLPAASLPAPAPMCTLDSPETSTCVWAGGDLRRPISVPQEILAIGICLLGGPTCGRGGGGEAEREWECDKPKILSVNEPVSVPCSRSLRSKLLLALVASQAAGLDSAVGKAFRGLCGSDWEGVAVQEAVLVWSPTRKLAVLAVQGSRGIDDWRLNLQVEQVQTRLPNGELVKVHSGFFTNYNAIQDGILKAVKTLPAGYELLITGHSLGAALAQWTAVDMVQRGLLSLDGSSGRRLLGVIGFSPPRLGGSHFQGVYHRTVGCDHTWLIGVAADVTPSLPRVWMGYRHTCPFSVVRHAKRVMPEAHQIYAVRNDLVSVLGNGIDFPPDFKEGCYPQLGSVRETKNAFLRHDFTKW